ncbi:alpha-D-xyloside xylohydrolase [Dysgonomonas alginatilytica]|uniref:Alpha-D-xyloside xylohydrolase n=1 Tax=Dysgonomonas alginatilytica TaxID=1605892 RepID=A0A2V3PIN6_9BACT|nr:TIM-barrel domain-containing protein [Dysgonomonas alginatilytica]PXV59960.1 alpha-D-xyloside xylohydrolase [Dysgonomonas alginatilytica]
MKNYRICIYYLFAIALFFSCNKTAENQPKELEKLAPGVWMLKYGTPEKIDLLSELGINPKFDAIKAMGEAELPIDRSEIKIEVIDGKTYLRFPLDENEKIWGLGLNFKTVEQRGRVMQLHVDHYGGRDNGRTHAPVPFFVSSKGYGALINSARYIDVWVGTGVRKDSQNPPVARDRNTDKEWSSQPYSDNLEFLIPAEGVEVILFSGSSTLDVVRRYNLYNGGGCLPPKWGLGFWHRVPTLYTDRDILNEVAEFEKQKFPLSVVGLEPGWMTRSYPCTYEWDSTRFPNPAQLVKQLADNHIKTNLWINPYISPDGELYKKLLPYSGSHTVWCGIVPDYTMTEVQQILKEHFIKHQLSIGVSGYKMDENDGYDQWLWPDVATFPSGVPAESMRQLYGSIMQKFTTDMYRKENLRTFGLVRSANAGTSSFPYVLYNDYYEHRDFITALINSSFIGVLWTPEVRASKSSEEWVRRMQTVCFSPLAMLNAWADGTKPWSFPDVAKEVNEIALLRMQLIPYLYTAFADYTFLGTPPIRAMNLEEGYTAYDAISQKAFDGTDNPYNTALKKEVKDQFMFGEYLLVAPLFAGEKTRQVILPQGRWYDFYTGEFAGQGEVISVSPGIGRIPVYVKDGGIVPMFPPITKITGEKLPVEIRHYGVKNGTYNLYDDDGETYNYEKGEYTRIKIDVTIDKDQKKTGKVDLPEGSQTWSFSEFSFKYMAK